MLAPTPGIASFAKFTCSITKHPPSHPSKLHILRWVLYFQRFLHHLWCLLSRSTLTFSNCAWAVCVCCLLRDADTFCLDSFWPVLPDPDYVVKQITYWLSVYKFLHSCSDRVVSTMACFIYYLTVCLGFSNYIAILCAQHIILNSWLCMCLRLPYFIRMLGAYDTLRFDSRLGVCWSLLNFIKTSWAHNISKFESSPYAYWLLNFPYNLWRLGCAGDSWTLSLHFGPKHLQFYSLMTMRVLDIFCAYEYYQSVFIICGTFPTF